MTSQSAVTSCSSGRAGAAGGRIARHPAVPAVVARLDALAFAVEYRPGERLSGRLLATLPAEFGNRLAAALAEMHRRGVVHLDLRHRSNVMVGEAGEPILIDFGSAFCFRPGSLRARLLLPPLARLDRLALAKWRSRLVGDGPIRRARGGRGGRGSGGRSRG